ncbi:pF11185 family protein [Prevotella sp. CAG:255]|uniref:DUF2971 domain-containing protein n=1 Tax=Prevotella sp. CAG:255 TaxID=1262923 RepID=UPI00033E276E|nr:DUF2971 domain-containing protein [Prevotella sp. CAG:255]CCX70002.1 pF11185 family protein [Prevotella sp. CAG:255]
MCNINYKGQNVLNGLDLDTPIYKFIPYKYLMTLIQGELYIKKISSWDDVYENFLFKEKFELEDQTPIDATNLISGIFGQSWTLEDETDAMWRIYSDVKSKDIGDCAIRVKTTARKLFDTIYTNDECMATTYIGKVDYKLSGELDNWLRKLYLTVETLNRSFVDSLFIKRMAFSHENEVRIIINFGSDAEECQSDHISFSINSETFIDEYLIDPRLASKREECCIKANLLRNGINSSKIKVSDLYAFKPSPQPIVIHN